MKWKGWFCLCALVYGIKLRGRFKKKKHLDTTTESNGLDARQSIPRNLEGEKVTKTVNSLLADTWKVPSHVVKELRGPHFILCQAICPHTSCAISS